MLAPHRSIRLCHRQRLSLIDREAANIHLAVVLFSLVCVAWKWPWQECRLVVCWLSVHASLSALHAFWFCRCHGFYRRHRTAIITALQSLQLAAVSQMLPTYTELAFRLEVSAGQVTRFTVTLLFCGLGSYSLATHCLVARLPWKAAVYFTVGGVLLTSCALLPQQAHFLGMPNVRDVALSMKYSVDTAYNLIMSLTAQSLLTVHSGLPLSTAGAAAAPSCCLLSLALWVHLFFGGLFPVYILYATAHDSSSSNHRSSPDASHQSLPSLLHERYCFSKVASAVAYHSVILFGWNMLLWALVDCLVILFENPARYLGICVE